MKVIRDEKGDVTGTITSNHGCLKFFGWVFAVCALGGLLTFQAGWIGFIFGLCIVGLIMFGLVIKNKEKNDGSAN